MMANQKNPFFKLDDFQSLETHLEGMNVTSQVRFPKTPSAIALIEIHEDGLTLELPDRSCAIGHALSLDINLKKNTSTDPIEDNIHILGVIEELEKTQTSRLKVRLKFRQYAQKDWSQFLDYFSKKQVALNKLIQKTRK